MNSSGRRLGLSRREPNWDSSKSRNPRGASGFRPIRADPTGGKTTENLILFTVIHAKSPGTVRFQEFRR
jgi:hypothetical protein